MDWQDADLFCIYFCTFHNAGPHKLNMCKTLNCKKTASGHFFKSRKLWTRKMWTLFDAELSQRGAPIVEQDGKISLSMIPIWICSTKLPPICLQHTLQFMFDYDSVPYRCNYCFPWTPLSRFNSNLRFFSESLKGAQEKDRWPGMNPVLVKHKLHVMYVGDTLAAVSLIVFIIQLTKTSFWLMPFDTKFLCTDKIAW